MGKSRSRKSNRPQQPSFIVTIDGHKMSLTRDQVLANGQGWQRCHGEFDGKKVESLSIKRMGDTVFVKNGQKIAGYDVAEIAVALPKIQNLIDGNSADNSQQK